MLARLQQSWFVPSSLVDLALLRIAVVAFQLGQLFGPLGPAQLEALCKRPADQWMPLPLVELALAPWGLEACPPFAGLLLLNAVGVGAGLCALAGLATPVSMLLFALISVFLQGVAYSFGEVHHPEALLLVALVALALSPSGRALSVDALLHNSSSERAGDLTSPYALWPRKLVQWLLALAYLSAAASKLATSGLDWANGFTLQYVLAEKGFETGRPLGVWLSRQHELALALSWAALIYEATFWSAILWPRLRRPMVLVGALHHTLIYATMGAPFFQFVVLFAAFAPWRSARGTGASAPARPPSTAAPDRASPRARA